MTEVERILKKGIISKGFLNPETRDGFYIEEYRKKIWLVELDLLLEFDKVCQKYNLKYYLVYGSLIGAVRHNGFIPWDDDLDVMMPRKDYIKLQQLLNEFEEPYFLQTPETDRGYAYSFIRLRNSNTSGISELFKYEKWNQGMYIDIFPNDNCIPELAQPVYDRIFYLNGQNSTYMRKSYPNLDEANKIRVAEHSGIDPYDAYCEIQELAQKYNDVETQYCYNIVSTMTALEKRIHFKEDYENVKYVDFEGFKFPIPAGYDRILKIIFGDYMQFPPIDDRIGHLTLDFQPEIPYRNYLK